MARPDLPPFAPLLVDDRSGIAGALIDRRHALGWTCEDLDDRAGWADRYATKLEAQRRPSSKLGFHFSWPTEVLPSGVIRPSGMAVIWVHSLGLRLVLVDEATADRLGAVPATGQPLSRTGHTGGNAGPGHARRRREKGIVPVMTAAAYETADRTLVATQTFNAAVTRHPWIAERPDLRAKAEAVEAVMAALYEQIREAA